MGQSDNNSDKLEENQYYEAEAAAILEDCTEGPRLLRSYDAHFPGVIKPGFLEDDVDCSVELAEVLIAACECDKAIAARESDKAEQEETPMDETIEEKVTREVSLGEWKVPVRVCRDRKAKPRKGPAILHIRDEIGDFFDNSFRGSTVACDTCPIFSSCGCNAFFS